MGIPISLRNNNIYTITLIEGNRFLKNQKNLEYNYYLIKMIDKQILNLNSKPFIPNESILKVLVF